MPFTLVVYTNYFDPTLPFNQQSSSQLPVMLPTKSFNFNLSLIYVQSSWPHWSGRWTHAFKWTSWFLVFLAYHLKRVKRCWWLIQSFLEVMRDTISIEWHEKIKQFSLSFCQFRKYPFFYLQGWKCEIRLFAQKIFMKTTILLSLF